MPPRQRFTKGDIDDEGGGKGEPPPSEWMQRWDVLSTIHRWRDELDQDLIEDLVKVASTTAYKKHVALTCGVRPALFEWWLSEGMRSDGPPLMQQLSCRFHMIQGFQSGQSLHRIQEAAARGDWNADAWLLSHRLPEWANKKESSTPDLGIETETTPPLLSAKQRREQALHAIKEAKATGAGELADMMREAGLLPPKLPG
jgi:hypothetical protein